MRSRARTSEYLERLPDPLRELLVEWTWPRGFIDGFGEVEGRTSGSLSSRADVDPSQTPIWISGMASSSIGWRELEYASVPFEVDGGSAIIEPIGALSSERTHSVFLVSGLRTRRDVMRGEETQLIGLMASPSTPDDTTWVLPGTHSKHVLVRNRTITDFRTFLTGELYAVLGRHSILASSVEATTVVEHPEAFRRGVRAAQDSTLTASLFEIRVRQVLGGAPRDEGAAHLSGLLIGDELSRSPLLGSGSIAFAAPASLDAAYRLAVDELGWSARAHFALRDAIDEATTRGHRALATTLPSKEG